MSVKEQSESTKQHSDQISPADMNGNLFVEHLNRRREIEIRLDSPDGKCEKSELTQGKDRSILEHENYINIDVQLNKAFSEMAELSIAHEIAILNHLKNRADLRIEELRATIPPLPEPDTTGNSYKLFVPRSDALTHLEQVWGSRLKYFNPHLDRDYLYQDQLGKLDPALLAAIKNRFKNDATAGKSKTKIFEVLPPKKARTDAEIAELPRTVRKNLVRLGTAAIGRSL